MGLQADFMGGQVLINDERLRIIRKLIKQMQVLHTLSIKRGVHQATQVPTN